MGRRNRIQIYALNVNTVINASTNHVRRGENTGTVFLKTVSCKFMAWYNQTQATFNSFWFDPNDTKISSTALYLQMDMNAPNTLRFHSFLDWTYKMNSTAQAGQKPLNFSDSHHLSLRFVRFLYCFAYYNYLISTFLAGPLLISQFSQIYRKYWLVILAHEKKITIGSDSKGRLFETGAPAVCYHLTLLELLSYINVQKKSLA